MTDRPPYDYTAAGLAAIKAEASGRHARRASINAAILGASRAGEFGADPLNNLVVGLRELGYAIVPVAPTAEMIESFGVAILEGVHRGVFEDGIEYSVGTAVMQDAWANILAVGALAARPTAHPDSDRRE